MPLDIANASSELLRSVWTGTRPLDADQSKAVREEALWEYWRRVAAGLVSFSVEELTFAFTTGIAGLGNVVGELARQGKLPAETFLRVRSLLTTSNDRTVAWALVQLNAREAVEALKVDAPHARGVLLDALLAKGTAWAAVLATPHLTIDEVDLLVTAAEHRRTFTNAQLH